MASNYPRSADTFATNIDQGVQITAETHLVPSTAPYQTTLTYLPQGAETNVAQQADGTYAEVSYETTLSITGFSEITSGTPAQGQFICDYDTGLLTFNASDGNTTISCDYETAGSVIYAADVNVLQDSVVAMQADLLGSHRDLKAVINTGEEGIDIFGGLYNLAGIITTFNALEDQSHAAWAVAGTYFVYLSSTGTLVLNGASYPNDCIPICRVTTATGGTVSALVDDRVQLSTGGSSSDIVQFGDAGAGGNETIQTATATTFTNAGTINMTLNYTSNVFLMVNGNFRIANTATTMAFTFAMDGALLAGSFRNHRFHTNNVWEIVSAMHTNLNVAAGAHTFNARWNTNGATQGSADTGRRFAAIAIRA